MNTSEPALLTGVLSAGLGLLVTLGAFGLTTDQATAITAVVTALLAAIAAAMTRPIAPAAFTGLVTAGADMLAGFHFHVSSGTVGAINMLVVAVLMAITRGNVTPVATLRRAGQ